MLSFFPFIAKLRNSIIVSSLPWDQGGEEMIFVSSARKGGGQLLNFKSQGGDTFRGKMILGSQAGGGTALS